MFFEVYADKEVDELISLLYSASARTAYQTHTILSSSAEEKEKPQVRERTSQIVQIYARIFEHRGTSMYPL